MAGVLSFVIISSASEWNEIGKSCYAKQDSKEERCRKTSHPLKNLRRKVMDERERDLLHGQWRNMFSCESPVAAGSHGAMSLSESVAPP